MYIKQIFDLLNCFLSCVRNMLVPLDTIYIMIYIKGIGGVLL